MKYQGNYAFLTFLGNYTTKFVAQPNHFYVKIGSDPTRFDRRAPTVAFTLQGYTPRQVAERLGQAGIFVWDGNYYALAVTEWLGVEESGGMVRVGIAHYNTAAEVDRLLSVVSDLARR